MSFFSEWRRRKTLKLDLDKAGEAQIAGYDYSKFNLIRHKVEKIPLWFGLFLCFSLFQGGWILGEASEGRFFGPDFLTFFSYSKIFKGLNLKGGVSRKKGPHFWTIFSCYSQISKGLNLKWSKWGERQFGRREGRLNWERSQRQLFNYLLF